MSLFLPDTGILFWMVLIFALIFFVLAKFGFPVITGMVEKRTDHIESSLAAAQKAGERIEQLAREQDLLIQKTKLEQGEIIKEASRTKDAIIADAKAQALTEVAKMVEQAKEQIAAERESVMRDVRNEVALLGMEVAEKVVRKELSANEDKIALVDRMLDEIPATKRS
ncbi:MAG: F0F1 ATP synthase subunit B [Bacteroidales bacterium]|nr:F0F1 ATP synthase subunit B [Bacteroidales bacterium]